MMINMISMKSELLVHFPLISMMDTASLASSRLLKGRTLTATLTDDMIFEKSFSVSQATDNFLNEPFKSET